VVAVIQGNQHGMYSTAAADHYAMLLNVKSYAVADVFMLVSVHSPRPLVIQASYLCLSASGSED